MLQVRAGRCPGCKEEAPPGAEYCPICGEYLGWQTTSGKNIPRGQSIAQKRRSGRNFVRTLIVLVGAYLVSLLGFHFFNSPSNSITEMPPIQSTPSPVTTGNSLGNAVDDTGLTDNLATDNAVTDNSVSNNSVSNSASTPAATATPNSGNALPDFDSQ